MTKPDLCYSVQDAKKDIRNAHIPNCQKCSGQGYITATVSPAHEMDIICDHCKGTGKQLIQEAS